MNIRLANPEVDDPRVVEIARTFFTNPPSVGALRETHVSPPPGGLVHRTVVEDDAGRIVGYGHAGRDPWDLPGEFFVRVVVEPDARGRGFGRALVEDAVAYARAHGATRLDSSVRDDSERDLTFVRRFGFDVTHHTFESFLDLGAFDETPFDGVVASVAATGLRFSTLAGEGETDENKRRLYELHRAASLDIPDSDGTFAPYDSFHKKYFEADWFRADAQYLAFDGDHLVGLGSLGVHPERLEGTNAFTGVDPAYRGRHVALALKLLVIRGARDRGLRRVRTNNNSLNAPILTLNRRLGYRPQPG